MRMVSSGLHGLRSRLASFVSGNSVTRQALEVGLMHEGVQWYLHGVAITDTLFTVNETYHDAQLAHDARGLMGVRVCPPIEGED